MLRHGVADGPDLYVQPVCDWDVPGKVLEPQPQRRPADDRLKMLDLCSHDSPRVPKSKLSRQYRFRSLPFEFRIDGDDTRSVGHRNLIVGRQHIPDSKQFFVGELIYDDLKLFFRRKDTGCSRIQQARRQGGRVFQRAHHPAQNLLFQRRFSGPRCHEKVQIQRQERPPLVVTRRG